VFFFISAPTIPEKNTGIVSDVAIAVEAVEAVVDVSIAAAEAIPAAESVAAAAVSDAAMSTEVVLAAEAVAGDFGWKKLRANTASLAIRSPFFIAETSALASPERTF
jgi:hypothetical protein